MDEESSFRKLGQDVTTSNEETSLEFRNLPEGGNDDACFVSKGNTNSKIVGDIGLSQNTGFNMKESKTCLSNNGHNEDCCEIIAEPEMKSEQGNFNANDSAKSIDPGNEDDGEVLGKLSGRQTSKEIQYRESKFKPPDSDSLENNSNVGTAARVTVHNSEISSYLPEEVRTFNVDLDTELNSGENVERWSYPRVTSKDSTFSDSPTSDFEFSASSSLTSGTEDSGICSSVRDDDLEEIPLHDKSSSQGKSISKQENELLKQISVLSVSEHLPPSWMPKTLNTYAPAHAGDDINDGGVKKQNRFRGLFLRSGSQNQKSIQSNQGWKLFGRLPPRPNDEPTQQASTRHNQSDKKQLSSPSSSGDTQSSCGEHTPKTKARMLSLKKNANTVPSSTTALIFENRPRNLPAKSAAEEKKHRQMYEAMIAEAKKKELKDLKEQKKKEKEKCKQEDGIANAVSVWTNEILPNWETLHCSKKAREMWWQGLPPSVRGKVWKLAIGNDLHITHELFDIFQAHAFEKLLVTRENKKKHKEVLQSKDRPPTPPPAVSKEHTVELIMLDVSRTFPSLCIFQKGGPYHDTLHSILGAYTCYRPDVGYVQGMSFIAAVLLLNMNPSDAFICFANILNKPCQLAFFRVDHSMMKAYFATFDIFLEEHLPKLHDHFKQENFSPDMYLIDWIFTLYSKSLPLDVASRVWDVFCRDGDVFLFSTALGILSFYQSELLQMDFIHLGQFLNKLPEEIPSNQLFQSIAASSVHKQTFNQILTQQKEIVTQIKTLSSASVEKGRI